jgi:hypothetical protein
MRHKELTEDERIVQSLLKLPPLTITISPLFLLMLAMALPEIITDPQIPNGVGPLLKKEGRALFEEIMDKLPAEVRNLLDTNERTES